MHLGANPALRSGAQNATAYAAFVSDGLLGVNITQLKKAPLR